MPEKRSGGGSGRGSRCGSGSRKPRKGEEKTSKLVRWTHELDIELLLAIQCWSAKAGMKLPWETMCKEYFGEPFTEGAITQHLAKLRLRRIEAGLRVPPPLRRSPKEAEKQAAALKRKNASNNDGEVGDSDDWGLFVSDNEEDDEDYLPATKRNRKSTKSAKSAKSKRGKAQETARAARLGIRLDPMREPSGNLGVDFTHHSSSDPSPFDLRYRDVRSTALQPTRGPRAHDTSTDESPANPIQTQAVPASGPPAFPGQFVPWTAVAAFPTVPAVPAVRGDQNLAPSTHGHNFNAATQANMYTPGFQAYPIARPASAISAGQRITGPASDITGHTFGPRYGSQQEYWQNWQNPVQPAGNQSSEVIDPQQLQSGAQVEFKREGNAADPEEEQEFDFIKEYWGDE